jgi:hypothetical protein
LKLELESSDKLGGFLQELLDFMFRKTCKEHEVRKSFIRIVIYDLKGNSLGKIILETKKELLLNFAKNYSYTLRHDFGEVMGWQISVCGIRNDYKLLKNKLDLTYKSKEVSLSFNNKLRKSAKSGQIDLELLLKVFIFRFEDKTGFEPHFKVSTQGNLEKEFLYIKQENIGVLISPRLAYVISDLSLAGGEIFECEIKEFDETSIEFTEEMLYSIFAKYFYFNMQELSRDSKILPTVNAGDFSKIYPYTITIENHSFKIYFVEV